MIMADLNLPILSMKEAGVEKEIVDPVKTVDYKLVWDKQKELPALAERFLEHVKDCLENHTQPERK